MIPLDLMRDTTRRALFVNNGIIPVILFMHDGVLVPAPNLDLGLRLNYVNTMGVWPLSIEYLDDSGVNYFIWLYALILNRGYLISTPLEYHASLCNDWQKGCLSTLLGRVGIRFVCVL